MEKYSTDIITGLVLFFITGGFVYIGRMVKHILKKLELNCLKHDALVHAWQKSTGNGFYESYSKKLEELIEQNKFVNQ